MRPASARRLLIKPHPLKADAWPLISLSAYQRVPSPKSLAWAGPYASRGTPSTPTSTQAEPATHPTEAINGHYRSRQTHRQRLPHPHQLPAPNTPHHMRPRRLHPNPTMKSQKRALTLCAPSRSLGSPDQAATTSLPSPRGIPTSPLPLVKHTNYRPQRLKRQSGTIPPTVERSEI